MSAVVLASHLPGRAVFASGKHPVVGVRCEGEHDYYRGLAEWWDRPETIVNVEHDMECSDALVDELLRCEQPLCTHAYLLHWPSTHRAEPHYAHRAGEHATTGGPWLSEGERWADYTGLGFCKITAQARAMPLELSEWQFLDLSVSVAVNARWHVHWPGVEHYHR